MKNKYPLGLAFRASERGGLAVIERKKKYPRDSRRVRVSSPRAQTTQRVVWAPGGILSKKNKKKNPSISRFERGRGWGGKCGCGHGLK